MNAIAANKPRMSVPEYAIHCLKECRRNWKQVLLPVIVALLLMQFVRIEVNYTDSLPTNVFITIKGWKANLERGEYVAYEFPSNSPVSLFRKGDHMVKIIGGVAGDTVVRRDDGETYILRSGEKSSETGMGYYGHPVGKTKPFTKAGKPLDPGPTGVIPQGRYYVFAPHKDSLDSRYAVVGYIGDDDIMGRTFPIF